MAVEYAAVEALQQVSKAADHPATLWHKSLTGMFTVHHHCNHYHDNTEIINYRNACAAVRACGF